jgi:hypothetical protein
VKLACVFGAASAARAFQASAQDAAQGDEAEGTVEKRQGSGSR